MLCKTRFSALAALKKPANDALNGVYGVLLFINDIYLLSIFIHIHLFLLPLLSLALSFLFIRFINVRIFHEISICTINWIEAGRAAAKASEQAVRNRSARRESRHRREQEDDHGAGSRPCAGMST